VQPLILLLIFYLQVKNSFLSLLSLIFNGLLYCIIAHVINISLFIIYYLLSLQSRLTLLGVGLVLNLLLFFYKYE
jgi:hypothetical protein